MNEDVRWFSSPESSSFLRRGKLELPALNSQAGAWELALNTKGLQWFGHLPGLRTSDVGRAVRALGAKARTARPTPIAFRAFCVFRGRSVFPMIITLSPLQNGSETKNPLRSTARQNPA